MGSLDHTPGAGAGVASGWSDVLRSEALAELERVLESPQFRTSKKCSRFFRHIVEAAVEGRLDCLKERTLGVDVFDREPHYDTNQDPIVRGTAGEVRKRLAQYYLEAGEGELRFSLPLGSYVPEAHYVTSERLNRFQPPATLTNTRRRQHWSGIGAVTLAICAVLAGGDWLLFRPTPLDRFWAPMLGGKTVLVCLGQPQFYTFRPSSARVLNSWFAAGQDTQQTPPIASVPLSEIVPMWDRSVALADAQAFSRLANLFARRASRWTCEARDRSLSDLRGKPSVFIGAFDNNWTLNLTGELRFYFDTDERAHAQGIRDRQQPAMTDWKLVNAWPPGKDINDINKDYALVTRVVNRTTEKTILILGGISQYGTEAAAEFVTNPTYFARALTRAPNNWSEKNIQVVLSTRVLSGVSGPPTVVATYFW